MTYLLLLTVCDELQLGHISLPKLPIKSFNKDQYMFVMAMCKSALESKGLECNKEAIDSFIKDMKLVYSYNF